MMAMQHTRSDAKQIAVLVGCVTWAICTPFARAVEPIVCDSTNGPCDCDSPEQLPNQSAGVLGYATVSQDAFGNDEDSCAAVGQCLEYSGNVLAPSPPGRTAIRVPQVNASSVVVGDTSPNPPGLKAALFDLASYSVNLCDPLCVEGVSYNLDAGQAATVGADGPYEWIDFFAVLTLENGDQVIGYEQHGVGDTGDGDKFNDPLIGTISDPNSEGTQGQRTLFFDDSYSVTNVTLYFDASTGFAYFGRESLQLSECALFIRGDSNCDGERDISDPIFTLIALFDSDRRPCCREAADANGSGDVDISDAVYDLNYLFLNGLPPPAPHPGCGSGIGSTECQTHVCNG